MTHSLALLADAGHMLTDVAGLGLALLANAAVLIVISLGVLYEAWERFRRPPAVSSGPMLVVAIVGLLVNLAGIFLLRKGSGESLNMKGAYFEVLSDMLTSVGVIVASVIMLTTGWYYADPLISAGIGLFILPRTWILLCEAAGVREMHDLHVWSLTSGVNAMSAHVVIVDDTLHNEVLHRRA